MGALPHLAMASLGTARITDNYCHTDQDLEYRQ
jgi:hypothetical protein